MVLPWGDMQQADPQAEAIDPMERPFDPKYEKQLVDFSGKESAGTIVIDTPNKFLYLVQGDGKALRYGIGVGKPGLRLGRRENDLSQARMAGLDATAGNAGAPPRPATPHGGRPVKSARGARDVSRLVALPHPRLQRALDHRHQRIVWLHPDAQRGRDRSLQPRQCRRQGRGDLIF